ncbi:hypothetical protein B0H13DRAFT_1648357, partial [Mycena leptocephala]
RLYGYYLQHNRDLYSHLPHLRRPFRRAVFSCATFNIGVNVQTFKHRDVLNLPFGLCAVQALGSFDPKHGGHLVLWDLKLVIEFPPGALILRPSAIIAHSNIPIQAGDELRCGWSGFPDTSTMASARRRSWSRRTRRSMHVACTYDGA